MFDYAARRRDLADRISEDAFITLNLEDSDRASIRYLTGFTGEGALVFCDAGATLVTDSRYAEQARREAPDLQIEETRAWTGKGLAAVVTESGFEKICFPSKRVTYDWFESFRQLGEYTLVPRKDPVAELRRVKSPEEVEQLRIAARLAEQALSSLIQELRVGMNEAEIALRLEWLIRQNEAEGIAFEFNISAGENTALNHYNPVMGRRPLRTGDLLLFDFGACVNGYRSDITRTFCVGSAPKKARAMYDLVLKANRAALNAVRRGATGVDVDATARNLISAAGHGEHFGHGLGHGIGLEVHEAPSLSPLSEDTLELGAVMTIEPGVYISGYGGVRIEDDVAVTSDGCDVITSFPKDRLIEVG